MDNGHGNDFYKFKPFEQTSSKKDHLYIANFINKTVLIMCCQEMTFSSKGVLIPLQLFDEGACTIC